LFCFTILFLSFFHSFPFPVSLPREPTVLAENTPFFTGNPSPPELLSLHRPQKSTANTTGEPHHQPYAISSPIITGEEPKNKKRGFG